MIRKVRSAYSHVRGYLSDAKLIVIDKRTVALVALCALAFAVLVGFKLHGSSAPMWNQVFGTEPHQGLVLGWPKVIRSDEWYATMPMVLSQANRGYPVSNAGLGTGASPLLLNVPVKHITTVARPQYWGYFALGPERGFSWYWWSKVFGMFLGSFFVLMLLTRSRFWLSALGASWLMASTFTQWWFSTNFPDMFPAACAVFIAGAYIALSKRRLLVLAAVPIAIAGAVTFAQTLYPPHQIPIAYLFAAAAIGFAVDRVRWKDLRALLPWRIAAALLIAGFVGALGFAFWRDAQATIAVVTSTVYPGQRRIGGGGVTLPILMIGTYSTFLREGNFPPAWIWANVVELSGFLLLWPIAAVGVVRGWISKLRRSPIELALLLFCVLVTVWMTLGFPAWLEHITLLDRATNLRAMAALGPASIFLCVVFLASKSNVANRAAALPRLPAAVAVVTTFTAAWLLGLDLAATTEGFFSSWTVFWVSLYLAGLAFLLLRRHSFLFGAAVLLFLLPTSVRINPLSQGLEPLTSKKLYGAVRELVTADPDARWIVYDNDTVANFIKSAGALAINGVQFSPEHAVMDVLDPTGASAQVWNRYARINFVPDVTNEATFQLTGDASYNITLNPCAPILGEIGVKYLAFVGQLPKRIECLQEVTDGPLNNVRIFTR